MAQPDDGQPTTPSLNALGHLGKHPNLPLACAYVAAACTQLSFLMQPSGGEGTSQVFSHEAQPPTTPSIVLPSEPCRCQLANSPVHAGTSLKSAGPAGDRPASLALNYRGFCNSDPWLRALSGVTSGAFLLVDVPSASNMPDREADESLALVRATLGASRPTLSFCGA